jgi:hypothetical protein
VPRTPATDTSGEARGCGHIAPQHRPHHVRPLDRTGNDTGFKRGGGATHARPRHQRRREGVRPRRTTTQAASRAATEPDRARHRIDEGRGCHARPAQTHTVGRYDHVAPETQATPRAAIGSGTCRIYLSWGHRDAHQRGMLSTRGSGEGVQPRCTDIDGRTTCGRGKRRQGYGRRGCQSSVHKSTLQAPTGANRRRPRTLIVTHPPPTAGTHGGARGRPSCRGCPADHGPSHGEADTHLRGLVRCVLRR